MSERFATGQAVSPQLGASDRRDNEERELSIPDLDLLANRKFDHPASWRTDNTMRAIPTAVKAVPVRASFIERTVLPLSQPGRLPPSTNSHTASAAAIAAQTPMINVGRRRKHFDHETPRVIDFA